MVADLLAKNRYAGIGEFHVYGEDVEKPVVRRVVQLEQIPIILFHSLQL